MLLARDLYEEIMGPFEDEATEYRMGRLRNDLDLFSLGRLIVVGRKRQNSFFKQLDPPDHEVWEIRSRDPKPSLRVFGAFAEQDVFVSIIVEQRTRLGVETSREFRDAIQRTKVAWRTLFLTYPRLSGDNWNAYIKENVADFSDLER